MATVSKNKSSQKSSNLTDIALVILSSAAQRKDRLVLPVPNSVTAPSERVSKTLTSLLSRGLVAECPAKLEDVIWRTDEQERHLALRISSAGEEAIAAGSTVDAQESETAREGSGRQAKRNRVVNPNRKTSRARPQKKTTKAATILTILRHPQGATIAQLVKATGWQAHSIRGFLSATIKTRMGLEVISERPEGKARRYRVAGTE